MILPFTRDVQVLQREIGKIDCEAGTLEASFEAIHRSLRPFSGSDLENPCGSKPTVTCLKQFRLDWRANASKGLILATDEDSDLPRDEKPFCQGEFTRSGDCMGNTRSRYEPSLFFLVFF